MGVYSKEQRDRAVDPYERYDFSPTAVIHELGYPSEPSLKAWHRDREHERATGEPSTRGARRRRYTDAQKHAADATTTSRMDAAWRARCGVWAIRKARRCSWHGSTSWRRTTRPRRGSSDA